MLIFWRKFALTIINQSMSDTLDTYHMVDSSRRRKGTPKVTPQWDNHHMLITLVVLFACCNMAYAK